MKRVAFIGAAAAWTAANLTDEVLPGLLDAVARFGYGRVAERDLPRALALVEGADATGLPAMARKALDAVNLAADREVRALRSIEDVWTGSDAARRMLDQKVQQWELYRAGSRNQVAGAVKLRAAALGLKQPIVPYVDPLERKYEAVVPSLAPGVRGREFSLTSREQYTSYLKEHPDALKSLALTPSLGNTILNFVNAQRSVAEIRRWVVFETGQDVSLQSVAGYLDILRTVGWIK
jgi:hypothetical protein